MAFSSRAALQVEVVAAPNFVVDSNVESPSTYGPKAAYLEARFSNTGTTTLSNVVAYIGNYIDGTNDTPGLYPTNRHPDASIVGPLPGGTFALTHEGGSSGLSDATRPIGTLAPGQTVVQYWLVSYPTKDVNGKAVWGPSVKPDDDLKLQYDVWGKADDAGVRTTSVDTETVAMRNEISALANKIFPNTANKVPPEYQALLNQYAPTWTNVASDGTPGTEISAQGVWYDLGNVGQGFDANGDLVPDRDLWMQPVGDPTLFDAGAFRLVHTYVLIIVKLKSGGEQIITAEDQLYFSGIPENNGAVGYVRYDFRTLKASASSALTPYQEVASGADNEKFNGDYGASIGQPLTSGVSAVNLNKTADRALAAPADTIRYALAFTNTGTVAVGDPANGLPLVIADRIPAGTVYVAGSASSSNSLPAGVTSYSIFYSTNNGAAWTATEPAAATNVTDIQWWLSDPLPVAAGGTVRFSVQIRSPYPPISPLMVNTGSMAFGTASAFAWSTAQTLITGTNRLGDTVFADDGSGGGSLGNMLQDGAEAGISNVTVRLYWDGNTNGVLDSADILMATTVTATNGIYAFTNLTDGRYVVAVDSTNAYLPLGYTPSTPVRYGVDLDSARTNGAAVVYLGADFGFAPAFAVSKRLTSSTPMYEGRFVTYTIDLTNRLPGDGTGVGTPIPYLAWATNATAVAAEWLAYTNVFGAPDGRYTTNLFTGASKAMTLANFPVGTQQGAVSNVSLLMPIQMIAPNDVDDTLRVDVSRISPAATLYSRTYTVTSLVSGTWTIPMTGSVSWLRQDFATNYTVTLTADKNSGNASGGIKIDSVGFLFPSDQTNAGASATTTLDPVPLVDTYNASFFQYVSASPVPSVVSTNGAYPNTVGTLSWANLGPIYPGGSRTVTVTLKALEPYNATSNTAAIVTNRASATNAYFIGGTRANPSTSLATNTLNPAGSIGDFIWRDINTNGVQDGGLEVGIPNVQVVLSPPAGIDVGAGPGVPVTNTTDSSGRYLFEGIPSSGSYTVSVLTATLPGAFTNTYDADGNKNNQTVVTNMNPTATNGLDKILTADFGYRLGTTIDGNIWNDLNRDGASAPASGEPWLAGVTVYLYSSTNLVTPIATNQTTSSGYFSFTGNYTGSYVVVVATNTGALTNGTWVQTYDSDVGTSGLSNRVTVSVSSGGTARADFSYYQSGAFSIGDTLFYDWNTNGVQNAATEEGIPNITVHLYRDANSNGVVDIGTDGLIATAVTDTGGQYLFTNQPPGSYLVLVDQGDAQFPPRYVCTADPYGAKDGLGALVVTSASNTNQDFGYWPYGNGSIGDTVWFDANADGAQSGLSERGLSNITVSLYVDMNGDGTYVLLATNQTDASGRYLFSSLPDGAYKIVVDTGDRDLPKDAFGYSAVATTATNTLVTITGGNSSLTNDFGFAALGAVGDRIFWDMNANGNQDWTEGGISNVTVNLYRDGNSNGVYDAGETLVATQVTSTNGAYLFAGLPQGRYVVMVNTNTLPAGALLTADPNNDGLPYGDPLATNYDHQVSVTLLPGGNYMGADFGYQPPGVIGDLLWVDTNTNGVRDAGEVGIPYVTVLLYSGTTLVASNQTDPDGYYSFGNLPDGTNYSVRVVTNSASFPAGLAPVYDPDGVLDSQASTIVISGGHISTVNGAAWTQGDLGIDFGYKYAGTNTISGTVGMDALPYDGVLGTEGSGVSAGEAPFSNVLVYAYVWRDANSNGVVDSGETTLMGSTTTTANGDYSFSGLPASIGSGSNYYIVSLAAPMDNLKLTTTNGATPAIRISETTNLVGETVSAYQVLSIAGSTTNVDFAFKSTLSLDFGDLPASYGTLFVDDGARHVVLATTNLYLGAKVDTEVDGQPSLVANGDDTNGVPDDEDGVLPVGIWQTGVSGGVVRVTVGAGQGWLCGYIDFNRNGTFADAGELCVSQAVAVGTYAVPFSIPAGAIATTNATQLYARFRLFDSEPVIPELAFAGLADNGEVEDYRFDFGTIGDTVFRDWNGNGVQDSGEEGLSGVTVTLTYYGTNGVPGGGDDVVVTAVTDASGNYTFSGLQAGNYSVDVPAPGAGGVPSGYTLTTGNDPLAVTLTANQQYQAADFGYRPGGTGSIGDQVFKDANRSGTFDGGDSGLSNITLRLYRDANGDGLIGEGDILVAVTNSGAGGGYTFTNLATGFSYIVDLDQTDPDLPAQFAASYLATTADPQAVPNLSGVYTAADFGYFPYVPGSIGDRVFIDANGDGVYTNTVDRPMPYVSVYLYVDVNSNGIFDASDTLYATTQSDTNGAYAFTNLPASAYVVAVDTADPDIPSGYIASLAQMGVTLGAGENRTDADFPFIPVISKTVDKTFAAAGDVLTYSISLDYVGNSLLTDAKVYDAFPTGVTFASATASGVYGPFVPSPGEPGIDPGVTVLLVTNAVADTFLEQANPDNVKNGDAHLKVNPDVAASKQKIALIQFDLSTVPAGSRILSSELGAYIGQVGALFTANVYRIVTPWAEASATWNTNGLPGSDWAGGSFGSGDYAATPYGSLSIAPVGWTSNSVTGLVQEWVEAGVANRGLALIGNAQSTDEVQYDTRAAAGTEPYLSVLYELPGSPNTTNTLAVDKVAVSNGGPITVTMTLWSSQTLSNVTPSLVFQSGDGTLSGPSPASGTVTAGTSRVFTFTAVPSSYGTVSFRGLASSASGYDFADALSPSVLVNINGSSNVVSWSLGTNSAAAPGASSSGGRLAAVYALKGDNTTTDWRYTVVSNAWGTVAVLPGAIGDGGALAYDGDNALYALGGGNKSTFYQYSVSNNTWTAKATTPANVGKGGALVCLASNTTQYVYALQGNTAAGFWRYNVAANTWTTLANAPYNVKEGGALATDGTCIYAFMGNVGGGQRRYFYRYDPRVNTWTQLADTLGDTGWGGALTRIGNYIYALCGNKTTAFYRYDIAGTNWTSLANTPAAVGKGGALATDGTHAYAMEGNNLQAFWLYNPQSDSWTAKASTPASVGGTAGGGSLAFVPGTALNQRTVDLGLSRSLTSSGTVVTVTMSLSTYTNETLVTPTALTVTGTNGATASLVSGPTPASQSMTSNSAATFVWTYLVRSGTNAGSVTFSGGATNSAGGTFGTAVSPSVLVVPPLRMTATVDAAGGVSVVPNFAFIQDASGAIPPTSSEIVRTYLSGSIGDRVWLDENSDGIQDAGEAGIANVMVVASNTTTGATYVNWTDSSGMYLFSGLAPGTYAIRVATNTLSAALASNPTYDPDSTTNSETTVALSAGQDIVTADFGYNWTLRNNVLNNTGTGAMGDRVWVDADGDGRQDPGEPGLGGVTVTLVGWGADGVPGTGDDTTNTTTTAGDGSYVFTGLVAGAYSVVVNGGTAPTGYAPSGDPDATLDNRTTAPILLAPGDVYVNADFGYQPLAGFGGTIGDQVWFDANADGLFNGSDPGIAGITVALIRDTNGDGVWDAGEPIVATTVTSTNGTYTFTGVPVADGSGTDDYLVWVNDTDGGLVGLTPTYDSNGIGTPNISAVSNLAAAGDLTQDFGYTVSGQTSASGLIGDTIFLDRNANGVADAGEGLEGVSVLLYDSAGAMVLASTLTDENGRYDFGGLHAGTYIVQVATNTLPGTAGQLTNTTDPDGGTASQSTVILTSGQINLLQDFGYRDLTSPNTIAGTIWNDRDADGFLDGTESNVYAGVTVTLYDTNGNVAATTVTDTNGNYSFTGLPDGTYRVDVTDTGNVLEGLWHSSGTAGTDNYSQSDPYTVAVSGGNTYPADFGYYGAPASLGNRVWSDLDQDGIQDAGEPGLAGVVVKLTVAWPNATTTVVETVTDAGGAYTFGNLLLDEHFDGAGGGEPVFTVSIPVMPGTASPIHAQGGDTAVDSGNPAGETATVTEGTFTDTYDFGFYNVDAFTATLGGAVYDDGGPGVTSAGNTISADDTPQAGVLMSLYRDLNGNGIADPGELVATALTDANGVYAFTNVANGAYLVVETDPAGASSDYDTQGSGTDNKIAVTISGGADSLSNNFLDDGATVAAISGAVYDDGGFGVGGNGSFDGTDAPIPAVLVNLYRDLNGNGVAEAGELVYTTVTGTNGAYTFPSLPSGSYLVVETNPSGATSVTDSDGTNNTADKIAVTLAGTPVTGQNFLDDGAAVYGISGAVYNDANGDSTFGGDAALANVIVTLYADLNNNGVVDSGDAAVGSVATDGTGAYSFTNIPNGNYLVYEANLAGYTSITDSGEPDPANNDNTIDVTVNGASSTGNNFLDGIFNSSIGDRVWLDENSDGIQDAGEAGIANVTVSLLDTNNAVLAVTVTDSDGRYLFHGLSPGTYVVRVGTNTMAAGLAANPTFDPDATTNSQTTVVLSAAQEVATADFGYNWATRNEVVNNTGTGAIGDRVWIDADGDGRQDAGELGMGGVTVKLVYLGPDGTLGTADDTTNTTMTADDGSYIFDGLTAGAYIVTVNGGSAPTGYTATGDPDGTFDNKTTTPIVLAPGDVYVNADFGYKPQAGYGATIGDTVWFDANADGTNNGSDHGIAGVTVALIRDSNGNGTWDSGELIIATTVTGTNGAYAFTGVPVTDGAGTDDYLVWVNDAGSVLVDMLETYDANGIGSPNISAVTDLTSSGNLTQDFGYTVMDQTFGDGLIGDTIFLDRNTNGVFDAGEGIEGVIVRLYNSSGHVLLAELATDENGFYAFGGLKNGTYEVVVDTNTLPGTAGQLTNTIDPDGGTADTAKATLSSAAKMDLLMDFGYRDLTTPNAISGTLWTDSDANGTMTGGETGRLAGVTVVLVDTNGQVVASALTDASGNYSFTGLPDGTFRVDVTDDGNLLEGYWHTDGTNDGADANSQTDPYTVTVTGGQTNTTADFGYYIVPAALGNRVWCDLNSDGLQTPEEPGMPVMSVTLQVVYAGGVTNLVVTRSGVEGYYRFGYLLLDEGLPASGAGAPVYVLIPGATTSVYPPTLVDVGGNVGTNDWLDSDSHSGVTAIATRGVVDMTVQTNPVAEPQAASYDFGYKFRPTLVLVTGFGAFTRDGGVIVRWETAEERATLGFWLERWQDGEYRRVNTTLLPGKIFSWDGGVYEVPDGGAAPGGHYTYRLIEVETSGTLRYLGPYSVTVDGEALSFNEWSRLIFDPSALPDPSAMGLEGDPDGDGMNNLAEFIAGTDPSSAASALRVTEFERGASSVVVGWESQSGRVYRIERSTDLGAGFAPAATGVPATPPWNNWTDRLDGAEGRVFYRIRVE